MTRWRPGSRRAVLPAAVAVLAAVLAIVLPLAAAAPAAQNRVGASHPAMIFTVGFSRPFPAVQGRREAVPRAKFVSGACVAPEDGAPAARVLKGPIADAVPRNLPEQLALDAAEAGQGTIIMRNLGDTPRLVANYGEGEWVKMQYVLRGSDSNVTVHYFRNLTTKMDVEFKFK